MKPTLRQRWIDWWMRTRRRERIWKATGMIGRHRLPKED